MAKIVTLKSPSNEDIYPVTDASGIRVTGNVTLQQALDGFVYADDPTAPANPDGWITNSDLNYGTLVKTGTWTNTTTLSATGSVAYTTVDVTSMGFSSKNDYIVVTVNQGGGSNDPFTSITVPYGYKSATSFRIELWNCHWASGVIGSGTKVQWAVFRLN